MLSIQKRLTNGFYVILSLPASAMGFALSVQIAALSWLLGTQYGLDLEEICLVWAAGPIAGIFGQVIFGVISDQVWFLNGRRRPFIFIGGILASLSLLALPNIDRIAEALGMEGLVGVAILVALTLDLSINVGFNPTRTIIADVTPEGHERTKGYTRMQTISGTLGMLAYVIGAVWDNYVLIYAGAVLVFLMSVLPPFFIEEPRELSFADSDDDQQEGQKLNFLSLLMIVQPLWGFFFYGIYGITARLSHMKDWNNYNQINTIILASCIGITVVTVFRSLFKRTKGLTKKEAGIVSFTKVLAAHSFTWLGVQSMFIYMFSYLSFTFPGFSDNNLGRTVSIVFLILNAVGAVLPAFVLEPTAKKIGRVKTHFYSILIMAIGYAGLWAIGQHPIIIYVLMGVLGVGWAATISLPFAIISQQVDQSRMGLYMGLFNLSVVLPQLMASLAVGEWVNQVEDKSILFIICAGSLAVSALAWYFVGEETSNEDQEQSAVPVSHH